MSNSLSSLNTKSNNGLASFLSACSGLSSPILRNVSNNKPTNINSIDSTTATLTLTSNELSTKTELHAAADH